MDYRTSESGNLRSLSAIQSTGTAVSMSIYNPLSAFILRQLRHLVNNVKHLTSWVMTCIKQKRKSKTKKGEWDLVTCDWHQTKHIFTLIVIISFFIHFKIKSLVVIWLVCSGVFTNTHVTAHDSSRMLTVSLEDKEAHKDKSNEEQSGENWSHHS